MTLTGSHWIGGEPSNEGRDVFHGTNPTTGEDLETAYRDATPAEIDRACRAAELAVEGYGSKTPQDRAAFLDAIAANLEGLGDELIQTAMAETGLPEKRLLGERGRTMGQLRMFAEMLREGSWVDAVIDTAMPDRKPLPKPDARRMNVPLGPVVVFGASNFPLAFSVAGGDTASALAAGCPVVVKGHPAHPGTSELAGRAMADAAAKTAMPPGTVSLVHGKSHQVGGLLVDHPVVRAVAFTGSPKGGRALMERAMQRPIPIPVFAEMGSANPVFVLPGAMAERGDEIASGMANSVVLDTGQFCTCPGISIGIAGDAQSAFVTRQADALAKMPVGTMVHSSILAGYQQGLAEVTGIEGVTVRAQAEGDGAHVSTAAAAVLLEADVGTFLNNPRLQHEVYGPASVTVTAESAADLVKIAQSLDGHLTATVMATDADLLEHGELLKVLSRKVGRLIVNGYPTGVEVCHAMVHGGPWPAASDPRTTSVGSASMQRFARPLCYQDMPDASLPAALQNSNPQGLWRVVNGERSQGKVSG